MLIGLNKCLLRPASGSGVFVPSGLFTGGIEGGFWDISDISTLYQSGTRASPGTAVAADGDPVGLILDKSGNNRDIVQATSSLRPLYKVSGGNKFLLFDGTDDLMRASFTMGTTWDRITAIQFLNWSAGNEVYYGAFSGSEQIFGSAAGILSMWNGSALGPTATGLSTGTDYVMTERWANPCQLAMDNGAYSSTPSVAATNPAGITLACDNGTANVSNMRFYGGVMINRALTGSEIAQQRTYWAVRQGRIL